MRRYESGLHVLPVALVDRLKIFVEDLKSFRFGTKDVRIRLE
jgi:hypothetical protein